MRMVRASACHFAFNPGPLEALKTATSLPGLDQEDLRMVVAEPRLDQVDELRHQGVQFEDAGDPPADLGDRGERVEAALGPFVQPGVVERRSGLVGEDREQPEVALVECARLRALDRDRADRRARHEQRAGRSPSGAGCR